MIDVTFMAKLSRNSIVSRNNYFDGRKHLALFFYLVFFLKERWFYNNLH